MLLHGIFCTQKKTKVLTNTERSKNRKDKHIDGTCKKVLPKEGCDKYLGRQVSFSEYQTAELNSRIAAGWATFAKLKDELCNRRYKTKQRIRLFDSVVTPTVLYGNVSWTLRKDHEQAITTARRSMIRKMFANRRLGDETWVEYIKRATKRSEEIMTTYGSTNWVQLHHTRKNSLREKWRYRKTRGGTSCC